MHFNCSVDDDDNNNGNDNITQGARLLIVRLKNLGSPR